MFGDKPDSMIVLNTCVDKGVPASLAVSRVPESTQVQPPSVPAFTLTCEECLGTEGQAFLSPGAHTAWIFRTSSSNHVSFFLKDKAYRKPFLDFM